MSAVVDVLAGLGRFARFCAAGTVAVPRARGQEWRALAFEMFSGSILVTLAVTAFAGAMLTVQGFASLTSFGTPELLGMFVSLSGVREVFPLIGAGCVGAKVGSAMAAELATMRLGQQVDALEVMAVNPLAWLVGPRLLGILLVMPAMTTIAIATTVVAGWAVAQFQLGLDGYQYFLLVQRTLSPLDLMVAQVKALSFGAVICLVSTFCGFVAPRGPEGVGQATNTAVVVCAVISVSINFLISQVAYGR